MSIGNSKHCPHRTCWSIASGFIFTGVGNSWDLLPMAAVTWWGDKHFSRSFFIPFKDVLITFRFVSASFGWYSRPKRANFSYTEFNWSKGKSLSVLLCSLRMHSMHLKQVRLSLSVTKMYCSDKMHPLWNFFGHVLHDICECWTQVLLIWMLHPVLQSFGINLSLQLQEDHTLLKGVVGCWTRQGWARGETGWSPWVIYSVCNKGLAVTCYDCYWIYPRWQIELDEDASCWALVDLDAFLALSLILDKDWPLEPLGCLIKLVGLQQSQIQMACCCWFCAG